jgi:hypothetical protein
MEAAEAWGRAVVWSYIPPEAQLMRENEDEWRNVQRFLNVAGNNRRQEVDQIDDQFFRISLSLISRQVTSLIC